MDTSSVMSSRPSGWEEWTAQKKAQDAAAATTLQMEDFYKLLAAQLRNQDMNNPLDNSEMMNQMTQMSMMQALTDMKSAINDLSVSNSTSYAASMIGRTGKFAQIDDDGNLVTDKDGNPTYITGTITSVDLYRFTFYINGDTKKAYPMSFLTTLIGDGGSGPDNGGSGEDSGSSDKPETV